MYITLIMIRTHKIRMVPTRTQEVKLLKACGVCRYAYNWALVEWVKMYDEYKTARANGEEGVKPSAYALSKRWTLERPEWSREVYRGSQTQAILNLGTAYHNFWNHKKGFPTKHKKKNRQTFCVDNAHAKIQNKHINLPNIGQVNLRESLRFTGKIISFTIVREADQWCVSVRVEIPEPAPSTNRSVVGVDVGIKSLAVASDGTVCNNPKGLQKRSRALNRLNRKLARQVKSSKRREKTRLKIAKTHLKIKNIRTDLTHKFTSSLAKNHGSAVVETLNIEGMQKNKTLARAIGEAAMGQIHYQLAYKMTVRRAPPFFPSSKRCSSCGLVKQELPLGVRVFKCEGCSAVIDRDLNAALNLKSVPEVLGDKVTASGSSSYKHVESRQGSKKREVVSLSS